jgi:hypothetical protein
MITLPPPSCSCTSGTVGGAPWVDPADTFPDVDWNRFIRWGHPLISDEATAKTRLSHRGTPLLLTVPTHTELFRMVG